MEHLFLYLGFWEFVPVYYMIFTLDPRFSLSLCKTNIIYWWYHAKLKNYDENWCEKYIKFIVLSSFYSHNQHISCWKMQWFLLYGGTPMGSSNQGDASEFPADIRNLFFFLERTCYIALGHIALCSAAHSLHG